jgi:uncharacterized protein YggU (UPF0235/DUF167 family)
MITPIPHAGGLVLAVLARPGSKRPGIIGERAGALMMAVTAPPEKGKANAAIRSALAEALACKARDITLLSGETSRRKRYLIAGVDAAELADRLALLIGNTERSKSPH